MADSCLLCEEEKLISSSANRSHDAIGHSKSELPRHSTDCIELDEFGLTRSKTELHNVVTLVVAFDCKSAELELEFLLQSVPLGLVLVEECDTSLVLVLVLVDLIRLLRFGVHSLRSLALLNTELLQLFWAVQHSTHHDLAGHCEASRVHLAEYYGFALAWQHLHVVTGSLLWLLHLQFVELGVVDVLAVLGLGLIINNVHVPVTLFGHGEVLGNAWCTLLGKVRSFSLSKLLLGARSHQHADQVILLPLTLLVAKEDSLAGTVATD